MRIYVVTLAFCKASVLSKALERFEAETDIEGIFVEKLVVDCRYPLSDGSIADVAEFFQAKFLDLGANLGVSGNYSAVFRHLSPKPDDVMVFYDPDSRPKSRSWLKDVCRVFWASECAFVSLSRQVADLAQPPPDVVINNVRCRKIEYACGWPMGAYRGSFARVAGTLEARDDSGVKHDFYGFGENDSLKRMKAHNQAAYMMMDQVDWGFEDPEIQGTFDLDYVAWKIESAHKRTNVDFCEWLRERGKLA